jgi:hypothetical protein
MAVEARADSENQPETAIAWECDVREKNTDATQNLPPDHPTQFGRGGTKLGLPKRSEVMDLLSRLGRKKQKQS